MLISKQIMMYSRKDANNETDDDNIDDDDDDHDTLLAVAINDANWPTIWQLLLLSLLLLLLWMLLMLLLSLPLLLFASSCCHLLYAMCGESEADKNREGEKVHKKHTNTKKKQNKIKKQ